MRESLAFIFFVSGAVLAAFGQWDRHAAEVEHQEARRLTAQVLSYTPHGSPHPREVHIGTWHPRNVAVQLEGLRFLAVRDDGTVFLCRGLEWFDWEGTSECVKVPVDGLLEGR